MCSKFRIINGSKKPLASKIGFFFNTLSHFKVSCHLFHLKWKKIVVLASLFSFCAGLAYGKDYGMHGNRGDTNLKNLKDDPKKEIHPLPRHILFPEVSYSRAPDVEGEFVLDFSDHQYWILAVIASWNERSSDITKIFNTKLGELKKRDIGVLGLFSQDTEHSIEEWRKKNKPLFSNYFASRNFLDSLKNPPVPEIWLLGQQGEMLLNYELPSTEQIHTLIEKSFILTGF